ncbi:MAG: cytochrome P450 [Rhodospirillaceae bacterium]|nr:cytochrome P450 [Rhodospirillaceae bacterium]
MLKFNLYSPEFDADPFPVYKTLRDEHPSYWYEETGIWIYSRYADIVTALNDWETYSSSKGNLVDELPNRAGNTLGTTDPPRHDHLKALIQKAVTKRALDHILEPAVSACRTHLDALAGEKTFDFVNDYSSNVTVDLLFYLFNMPKENQQIVRDKAVLMVQSDAATRQKGPAQLEAFEWMTNYAGDLIEERKKNPGDDLLSNFITAEINGEKLKEREVLLTVTTLIMAGIESLSGFMSVFAMNLADHADARRAIAADPSLIPDAMEESLRYNTSAQRFKRTLMKDVNIHGQTMKAGDPLILAYGSANRDERQFENPDVYDITRKPKGHLGFGGGVHACLGTAIARMACKVAFEEFIGRYPEFERTQETLPWVPSSNFRSPSQLELRVG